MIDPNRLCFGCMNELEEENKICKICGWNNETGENNPHQLQPGTILQGKYLVGKVLGEGGFGITYLGWNILLQEKVAIKEFYPHGFVGRDATVSTTVMSYIGQEEFTEKQRDSFIKESRTMSDLRKIEGIVEMKDIFTENGTVYIVMEYIEGENLKEYVNKNGNLSMDRAIQLLSPVINALEKVHASGLIHRDISPDNIMIGPDGKVTLLDFGAARQISADGGHSLTINLKHGYAPMEQYQTHGEQGPWTDIYALCATIYRLITGKVLPSAADRVLDDCLVKPSELGAKISPEQEKVLLKGLAVRITERYLNIFELRDAFNKTGGVNIYEDEASRRIRVYDEAISLMKKNTLADCAVAIEKFKEISGYKDSKEKIAECENIIENLKIVYAQKEEEKKKARKRNKKIAAICAGVAAAAVVFVTVLLPMIKYNSALNLVENKQFDEAVAAFTELEDYKDSADQIAVTYAKAAVDLAEKGDMLGAEKLIGNYVEKSSVSKAKQIIADCASSFSKQSKFEDAITLFESVKSHSGVEDKIKETKYEFAKSESAAGNYQKAYELFDELGRYKDSVDLEDENRYNYAMECIEESKYETAIDVMKFIPLNYKDVRDQIKNCKLEASKIRFESKQYIKALELYRDSGATNKSDEYYKKVYYNAAVEYMKQKTSNGYKTAIDFFDNVIGYKDSKSLQNEAKYCYVKLNKNNDNKTTFNYLKELRNKGYKDSGKIYNELYAWKITVTAINGSKDNKTTMKSSISKYDPVFFHFKLTGGEPGAKTDVSIYVSHPNGTYYFGYKFEDWDSTYTGWYGWEESIYVNPYAGYGGTLKLKFFDQNGNLIGEGSVKITG